MLVGQFRRILNGEFLWINIYCSVTRYQQHIYRYPLLNFFPPENMSTFIICENARIKTESSAKINSSKNKIYKGICNGNGLIIFISDLINEQFYNVIFLFHTFLVLTVQISGLYVNNGWYLYFVFMQFSGDKILYFYVKILTFYTIFIIYNNNS